MTKRHIVFSAIMAVAVLAVATAVILVVVGRQSGDEEALGEQPSPPNQVVAQTPTATPLPTLTPAPPLPTPPNLDTSGWLTYDSPDGISVRYPPDWTLDIRDQIYVLNPARAAALAEALAQGEVDVREAPGTARFVVDVGSASLYDADFLMRRCVELGREATTTVYMGLPSILCQQSTVDSDGLHTVELVHLVEFPAGQATSIGYAASSVTPSEIAKLAAIIESVTVVSVP